MSLTVTITQFSGGVTASENPDLHGIANYLYALCAPYNLEAAIISGAGGGGSISPVNPSSPPSIVDFYVSDTTPIVTGVIQHTSHSLKVTTLYSLEMAGLNLQQTMA